MTTLSIANLCLSYGAVPVLGGVTLPPVPPGSMVGILGPNGVGKSTMLRALAGLQPYRGQVMLDDESLSAMAHARRVARIGYLPQTLPQATTLIAYEAVVSACRAVRPDLSRMAVEAATEAVFDLLAIRHLAFRPLNRLSGGQRQMVGLAQVVVRRPAILLLDEPTSALDLRWRLNVLDVVRDIVKREEGLCLMALHDINLALHHCDYIALFSDGRLQTFGAPVEAMTADVLRRAYRVEGRVEISSDGTPFVLTDRVADMGVRADFAD